METRIEDAKYYQFIFQNNGVSPDGSARMKIEDMIATQTASQWMPKVISNIVKESMEPILVGTRLLQRLNYSYGQVITFGAMGAMTAADIPEGGEFPERSVQPGGATVQATVGKSGLAVKFTDEMIRYSQFDVMGLHLREAGRALARHKELKIFNMIRNMGVKVFDNVSPTASIKGVTTGRDLTGSGNGSITMDDVFDTFAQVMVQGFVPDTLLMHPLTWIMFVKDPVLRTFAINSGGGTFFAGWTGNPNQVSWMNSLRGGMAGGAGQNIVPGGNAAGLSATEVEGYHPQMDSAPVLPNYLGLPFRIIVSPFVYFDPRRMLTDIYVFDSNELGALVVDEEVRTDEWTDPRNDIRKVKLWERYGLAMFHEGQQAAVIKNVHVVPNEIVLPARTSIDVSGSVAAISPTASVLS